MKTAALRMTQELLVEELATISKDHLWSPPKRELSAEELTRISFEELIPHIKKDAPLAWGILRGLAYSRRQEEHNTRKNPDKVLNHGLSAGPKS